MLQSIWLSYQPIVRLTDRAVFGYEALVRSQLPSLGTPDRLFAHAQTSGRVRALTRRIRHLAPEPFSGPRPEHRLFLNVHPSELQDPELVRPDTPLAAMAGHVVLELSEEMLFGALVAARAQLQQLQRLGFAIALDDVGSGRTGLRTVDLVEPDVIKLDRVWIRDIHKSPTQQNWVRNWLSVCAERGIALVAEGVETPDELSALTDAGCELVQGFLFSRPGRAFPGVRWPEG